MLDRRAVERAAVTPAIRGAVCGEEGSQFPGAHGVALQGGEGADGLAHLFDVGAAAGAAIQVGP